LSVNPRRKLEIRPKSFYRIVHDYQTISLGMFDVWGLQFNVVNIQNKGSRWKGGPDSNLKRAFGHSPNKKVWGKRPKIFRTYIHKPQVILGKVLHFLVLTHKRTTKRLARAYIIQIIQIETMRTQFNGHSLNAFHFAFTFNAFLYNLTLD